MGKSLKRNDKILKDIPMNTDKLLHDNQEQQHKHADLIPCKEQQHKASPCKKK